ncbi:MAG: HEPN domain-containing protein [bacterium]
MKTRLDLVHGWCRKADSDLANLALCVNHEAALDTACFHAQQAAEKMLKAYLVDQGIEFPFVHNLEVLLKRCAEQESAFNELLDEAVKLTPFAVGLRYDDEFWPSLNEVIEAQNAALKIRDFVIRRLDAGLRS